MKKNNSIFDHFRWQTNKDIEKPNNDLNSVIENIEHSNDYIKKWNHGLIKKEWFLKWLLLWFFLGSIMLWTIYYFLINNIITFDKLSEIFFILGLFLVLINYIYLLIRKKINKRNKNKINWNIDSLDLLNISKEIFKMSKEFKETTKGIKLLKFKVWIVIGLFFSILFFLLFFIWI